MTSVPPRTNPPRPPTGRLLAALTALLGTIAACGGDHPPAPPKDPTQADATALTGKPTVVFATAQGDVPVVVDVARTPTQKEQGLMWVEHLPEGRGMIFLMGPERLLTFWMKNTYIPLDMIFLDSQRVVVGVVQNAEPLTLTPRRVDKPSAYVVEVSGGFTAKHGIAAGTRARFESLVE